LEKGDQDPNRMEGFKETQKKRESKQKKMNFPRGTLPLALAPFAPRNGTRSKGGVGKGVTFGESRKIGAPDPESTQV